MYLFFSTLKTLFHWLFICIVSNKKSAVIFILVPLYIMYLFSLVTLRFFSTDGFEHFMIWYGVTFLMFPVLAVHGYSWFRFGKCPSLFLLILFFLIFFSFYSSLSLLSFGESITHMLGCLMLSCRSLMLSSFLFLCLVSLWFYLK